MAEVAVMFHGRVFDVSFMFHSQVAEVSVKFHSHVGGFLVVVFFPCKSLTLEPGGHWFLIVLLGLLLLLSGSDATYLCLGALMLQ